MSARFCRDGKPAEAAARSSGFAHKQEISFCRSADNINIAYAEVGNGPPLIKAANWLTHLEYDWESPVWSPLLQRLAEKNRLVRYDTRGTGLSDREVEEFSFDGFMRDFESVIDAVEDRIGLPFSASRKVRPLRLPTLRLIRKESQT